MSFPTQPAFIHSGSWDAESRKHPAMKWMEAYTDAFDSRESWSTPYTDWHVEDWYGVKADGQATSTGQKGWEELKEVYAPFLQQKHEPYFLVCFETHDGYEMIGQALVYGKLPGHPTADEKRVQDRSGKEWDVAVPGGFHFFYVKGDGAKHGGFLMKKSEIMSDSIPVVTILQKRGLLKQE